MAINPYRPATDPFTPMVEDFLRPLAGWGGRMGNLLQAPHADVVERENEIRVTVELPGMEAGDIDVNLENNLLTISGEKKEERQEERDTWHLSERRYGKFTRSFVLPRDVEPDGIQARVDNGVLSVTIPKSEKARRRHIQIESGAGQQRVEASTTSRK